MSCAFDLRTHGTFAIERVLDGLHTSEQHLSELQLTITDADATRAGDAIAASSSLKRLMLRKDYTTTWKKASWRVLLEGVVKNVSLSSLSLAHNKMSNSALIALRVHSMLVKLDVGQT